MQNGEYLNIADFTTKEQPKNADDCVFFLETEIKYALDNVRWWFELPNDEAYKQNPNLKFDLHRTGEPMFAFPGCIGVAVLFFSNTAHSDPFLREHRQMYLDGYLSGWNDFQLYSERSVRFGSQPIQDRKRALFDQFVEYRAKHIGKGFQATLLRQMGYDAGFMFALAQELRDIDKIMPVSQETKIKKKSGRPKKEISDVIPDNKNYNLVIERIRAVVANSGYDKALAVADEIKRLQKENIIIKDLDTSVKCLHDFLAAEIPDLPCYRNVVDNIRLL
ncbi:hypothetical protein [uncultured Alistipes sp.]|uniref:hypothetical protein n=1 Tax=uncultured Alistipes sp. TaxID=538949 RepID=UPI0028056328|nr:hypothetical protein [uncultured Alistipes sp.]